MAATQSQTEFVNAVHGCVTYGWTKGFFYLDEDENDKEIADVGWTGGRSWRRVGWKLAHFDIVFSDIPDA